MTPSERRATLILAAILILRMTALFMVLPVLAPYALELAGQPMLAVGLAVGAYGLTQVVLQIPFGWLSDRIGRKPVIAGGLLIFAAGSLLASVAESINALAFARLMQGGGAIAAASIALLSDLTRESVRTTAMAIVGASIGGSFLLALILGPALLSFMPVPGLFVLSALGASMALLLLLLLPEAPPPQVEASDHASILRADLLSLDIGVFCLHAILASLFIGLPLLLEAQWHWASSQHWKLYLPVMLAALALILPAIRWLEKREQVSAVIPLAVMLLLLGPLLVARADWTLVPGLCLFFCGFNYLEASLPSRLTAIAPAGTRGRAMGVFSSAQFLGAFVGAAVAAWVLVRWDASATILSCSFWALIWLCLMLARNELRNTLRLIRRTDALEASMSATAMTQSRRANESRN